MPGSRDSWSVATGIGMLMFAVLLLFREWGLWVGDALVWPVVLAAAGGALIWRQSASAAQPAPEPAEVERRRAGSSALGRAALGVGLVVGAALLFLYFNDALAPARDMVLPVVVVLVAATLILAPFWIRLVRGLADERAERVRSQERAELAAHLHDSVLQTLALMQRQADNPRDVAGARPPPGARAARVAQRRPAVRRALDASRPRSSWPPPRRRRRTACRSTSWRSATRSSTTHAEAVVAAAREAIVNAAKFGERRGGVGLRRGARRRARGVRARPRAGLRPRRGAGRPPRRARVDRRPHGAPRRRRAAIHSTTGEGTEVELRMARA